MSQTTYPLPGRIVDLREQRVAIAIVVVYLALSLVVVFLTWDYDDVRSVEGLGIVAEVLGLGFLGVMEFVTFRLSLASERMRVFERWEEHERTRPRLKIQRLIRDGYVALLTEVSNEGWEVAKNCQARVELWPENDPSDVQRSALRWESPYVSSSWKLDIPPKGSDMFSFLEVGHPKYGPPEESAKRWVLRIGPEPLFSQGSGDRRYPSGTLTQPGSYVGQLYLSADDVPATIFPFRIAWEGTDHATLTLGDVNLNPASKKRFQAETRLPIPGEAYPKGSENGSPES